MLNLGGSTEHSHTATQRQRMIPVLQITPPYKAKLNWELLDLAAIKPKAWSYSKCRGNDVLMKKNKIRLPLQELT